MICLLIPPSKPTHQTRDMNFLLNSLPYFPPQTKQGIENKVNFPSQFPLSTPTTNSHASSYVVAKHTLGEK
jgi:hypothetical protein